MPQLSLFSCGVRHVASIQESAAVQPIRKSKDLQKLQAQRAIDLTLEAEDREIQAWAKAHQGPAHGQVGSEYVLRCTSLHVYRATLDFLIASTMGMHVCILVY